MKIVLDCILSPKDINTDYQNNILKKLQEEYTFKSLKQGYITKVNNIIDILYNNINSNYNLNVKSLCDVNIIELKKDIILEDCEIIMIHNNGIFVNKFTIKILIPNNNTFEYSNNQCIYKDKVYKCTDKINVVIQDIRFEKNEYTCIGIFKD